MVVRLAGSRLMLWFESTLAWRIFGWRLVPRLVRLTGGRLSLIPAVRTALLETKDARNGRPHRRVVIYFHDGERVTIIPSKGGLPEDPFWYENAMAEPNVVFGGQSFRAELVLDEAQQARLWALADRYFPPYAAYRARAGRSGRRIPILQLVRTETAATVAGIAR